MKCPNCGYNSFDYLEVCKKCKLPLNPSSESKSRYKRLSDKSRGGLGGSVESSKHKDTEVRQKVTEDEYALDSEQDIPVYHKRHDYDDYNDQTVPDNSESDDNVQVKEQYFEGPESFVEPSSAHEEHEYSEDPLLYSESPEIDTVTNFREVSESLPEEESYSIAGLKIRAAAFAIDILIVGLITYITIQAGFYFLEEQGIKAAELSRVFLPIYALLFFLASTYFIFLHYFAGRTIGKMALGIKLISTDGTDIGLWESFMRWVGYYISAVFLFAGFVWSIFDPESQAWHDKIAGTYVVTG